jgi:osmotically inducible protein OsmC
MPVRRADATWKGSLQEGTGSFRTGSGAVEGTYTFGTRFEEEPGTNPEELVGAAHAGCYSMALSGGLGRAGATDISIATTADVTIEKLEAGFTITGIHLQTRVSAAGIDEEEFQKVAAATKDACPVSRALASVPITLEATLAT